MWQDVVVGKLGCHSGAPRFRSPSRPGCTSCLLSFYSCLQLIILAPYLQTHNCCNIITKTSNDIIAGDVRWKFILNKQLCCFIFSDPLWLPLLDIGDGHLLCILTSFWVLRAPESRSKYFFHPFSTFFVNFESFSV